MSFFEGQTPAWTQQHGRQQSQSWDQSSTNLHPGRSIRPPVGEDFTLTGRAGPGLTPSREEASAFACQFEGVFNPIPVLPNLSTHSEENMEQIFMRMGE